MAKWGGGRDAALPSFYETPKPQVVWSTVFPIARSPPHPFLTANEKDFSHSLEMTTRGKNYTPSFLWKEVPRRGGGWLLVV